ncbi:hypothetical protein [Pseudonocardia sp. GCM10023141]|uniref:hypothetical protein n=1 Tax=Pseudonocardia sp. GCM10023141 TaxID=3252653 RepID=UPI00361882E3
MSEDLLAFVRELQNNSELHNVFLQQPTAILNEYDLSHVDAQYVLNLVGGGAPISVDAGHLQLADGDGGVLSGLGAVAHAGPVSAAAVLPDHLAGAPDLTAFGLGDTLSGLTGSTSSFGSADGLLHASQISTVEHSVSSLTSVGHGFGDSSATGWLDSFTSHEETTTHHHQQSGAHHADDTAAAPAHGLLDGALLHLAL